MNHNLYVLFCARQVVPMQSNGEDARDALGNEGGGENLESHVSCLARPATNTLSLVYALMVCENDSEFSLGGDLFPLDPIWPTNHVRHTIMRASGSVCRNYGSISSVVTQPGFPRDPGAARCLKAQTSILILVVFSCTCSEPEHGRFDVLPSCNTNSLETTSHGGTQSHTPVSRAPPSAHLCPTR